MANAVAVTEETVPVVVDEGPQPASEVYTPRPAFQLNRFKGTIYFVCNEEFGDQLLELLNGHAELPSPLYTFRQKLDQRLND